MVDPNAARRAYRRAKGETERQAKRALREAQRRLAARHPDDFRQLLGESRAELGLPPEPKPGRPPRRRAPIAEPDGRAGCG